MAPGPCLPVRVLAVLLLILGTADSFGPAHTHFADGDLLFVQPPSSAGNAFDAAIRQTGLATIAWLKGQNVTVHGNQTAVHVAIAWHGTCVCACIIAFKHGMAMVASCCCLAGWHLVHLSCVRTLSRRQHAAPIMAFVDHEHPMSDVVHMFVLARCLHIHAVCTQPDTSGGQTELKFVEAVPPTVIVTPSQEFFARYPQGTRLYHGRLSTVGTVCNCDRCCNFWLVHGVQHDSYTLAARLCSSATRHLRCPRFPHLNSILLQTRPCPVQFPHLFCCKQRRPCLLRVPSRALAAALCLCLSAGRCVC